MRSQEYAPITPKIDRLFIDYQKNKPVEAYTPYFLTNEFVSKRFGKLVEDIRFMNNYYAGGRGKKRIVEQQLDERLKLVRNYCTFIGAYSVQQVKIRDMRIAGATEEDIDNLEADRILEGMYSIKEEDSQDKYDKLLVDLGIHILVTQDESIRERCKDQLQAHWKRLGYDGRTYIEDRDEH
jgi:hypothetical protein